MSRIPMVVVVLACVCLGARAEQNSRPSEGLTNPFYALVNGVQDDKHPTPESQARMLKELGYDGIGTSGVGGIREMLAALDRYGLKLFTVYVGAWLDGDQPTYDPQLPEAIKLLKGRDTMIWLYVRSKQRKPSSPAGDARAVAIIRELADAAKPSGIRIALYPHTWFWIERVEDAVRVAKKVDRDNVGVTFNLCHWLKVDDPKTMTARLELARPYLYQVTINGADTDGQGWDTLIQPLDRGSFDTCVLLRALRRLGYKGPIGLQCYGVKGDKYENLRRSMAAWRGLKARLAAERASAEIVCEGTYRSHLQGMTTDGKGALYWSFTQDLVKTDMAGKVLKHIAVRSHHGDPTYHDGKLYVAVNLGKFNEEPGEAGSWVYVYDGRDLSPISKHPVPEVVHGAGGMAYRKGRLIIVGGLPKSYRENYLYEYDADLKFIKRHVLKSGYTLLGIQTASYADGTWWLGCYGNVLLKADDSFRLIGKYNFDGAYGIVKIADDHYIVGRCFDKSRRGKAISARPDPTKGMVLSQPDTKKTGQ